MADVAELIWRYSMSENWYAIYTKRHYEKKFCENVLGLIQQMEFYGETYLPLRIEEAQWSDRKKRKSVPLFNNYVFVKHDDNGFDKLKKMPGFCEYVRFSQYPAVIPEEQIEMIKNISSSDRNVSSGSMTLMQGDKVRISKGPMKDYEGTLVENQGSSKVAIEIKNFSQCLLVNVAIDNIVKL
ncbi:MAG: transcriptional antiterminator RfaH [Oleispira sp.]